jgi:TRAP-type uncharacterized transport system substrate-binding protein
MDPGKLRLPLKITVVSWWALLQTVGPFLLLAAITVWAALHFAHSAPPRTLTMSSGPKGSTFETNAERYAKILRRNGITLKIVESEGSIDNLNRLSDRKSHIDIALVQSGLEPSGDAGNPADLVSLGSMFYQPLTIFYRSPKPMVRLSELAAHRIAVGPEGSGTRFLALALLKANGIEPQGPTQLLSLEGEDARKALLHNQVDAIFLTGDSAAPATVREMLHAEGVRLFDFVQVDAYVRRFPYLNKLTIPAGAFDLGENLPPNEIYLLAPTVELLAHSDLHPALVDLLIEAGMEVHGHAALTHTAGQFPSPVMITFPLSSEAARYYKSGAKSLTYRYLPFWLASLVDRLIVLLVPILVVVIPGLRYLPQLYRWRIDTRIHHRYGELMAVEREALGQLSDERRAALIDRLGEIERSVIRRKIPGSHAEQVYLLRQHIGFVRERLARPATVSEPARAYSPGP